MFIAKKVDLSSFKEATEFVASNMVVFWHFYTCILGNLFKPTIFTSFWPPLRSPPQKINIPIHLRMAFTPINNHSVQQNAKCLPSSERPYCHPVVRQPDTGGSLTGKIQRKGNYYNNSWTNRQVLSWVSTRIWPLHSSIWPTRHCYGSLSILFTHFLHLNWPHYYDWLELLQIPKLFK